MAATIGLTGQRGLALILATPVKDLSTVFQECLCFPALSVQKRSLAYYRFHKRVGKGDWNRYRERYMRPRSLEHTSRMYFNYSPSFHEAKRSLQWLWNLPKRIARATSTEELLRIWVHYRFKKKKPFHYLLVLKRLLEVRQGGRGGASGVVRSCGFVSADSQGLLDAGDTQVRRRRYSDVGGVDVTDWRFRLISSRLEDGRVYRFINVGRLVTYLGQLGCRSLLEKITGIVVRRCKGAGAGNPIPPHQLCQVLWAYGVCRLQDKYLVQIVGGEALRVLDRLQTLDLLKLVEGLAGCQVHHYGLLAGISSEVQSRVGRATVSDATAEADGNNRKLEDEKTFSRGGRRSRETTELQPQTEEAQEKESESDVIVIDSDAPSQSDFHEKDEKEDEMRLPSPSDSADQRRKTADLYLPDLALLADFAFGFATLKFQDYSFFELCSLQTQHALRQHRSMNPWTLSRMIDAFRIVKINDVRLLEKVSAHFGERCHEAPPMCIAMVGWYSSRLLPGCLPEIQRIHKAFVQVLLTHVPLMDLSLIAQTASFARGAKVHFKSRTLLVQRLAERVLDLRLDRAAFDVGRLIEVFVAFDINDARVYDILTRHVHKFLDMYEPVDFCRTARALVRVHRLTGFKDDRVINALSRNTIRHEDEFCGMDYRRTVSDLCTVGPPEPRYASKLLHFVKKKHILPEFQERQLPSLTLPRKHQDAYFKNRRRYIRLQKAVVGANDDEVHASVCAENAVQEETVMERETDTLRETC